MNNGHFSAFLISRSFDDGPSLMDNGYFGKGHFGNHFIKFIPFRMNYIMQNYEMDKNGLFRHKTNSKDSPMQDFVITKQKYRKVSNILEPNISEMFAI